MGRREGEWGWLALQQLNIMQKCPYSINIIINKSFKINSISMTLTSGSPGGVGDDILPKLKPVSNAIKYKVNLYKAL